MYVSTNDDLFDDSYFTFELITDLRLRELSGTQIKLRDKVVYFSEAFVDQLYWIDIEKDIDFKLADLFRYSSNNSFSSIINSYYNLPTFYYNYETLSGYNKNITDFISSDDGEIRNLGYNLFKLELYKEFRKHFIPKFKTI